jgi:hypothetical protein
MSGNFSLSSGVEGLTLVASPPSPALHLPDPLCCFWEVVRALSASGQLTLAFLMKITRSDTETLQYGKVVYLLFGLFKNAFPSNWVFHKFQDQCGESGELIGHIDKSFPTSRTWRCIISEVLCLALKKAWNRKKAADLPAAQHFQLLSNCSLDLSAPCAFQS